MSYILKNWKVYELNLKNWKISGIHLKNWNLKCWKSPHTGPWKMRLAQALDEGRGGGEVERGAEGEEGVRGPDEAGVEGVRENHIRADSR